VRSLLLLNMLDGAGPAIVARARAIRAGEPVGFLFLPETRFACQGSGACCRNYMFGPLEDEDCARLDALDADARRAMPDLGDGPLYVTLPPEKGGDRFLRTVDDHCIFLRPDERCGLHAAFGADAKPGLCRLFPYVALPTLLGIKIFDGGECASFATSARCGTPLTEDFERVRRLAGTHFNLYHPTVLLDARTPCDYGHFLRLQERLCEIVAMGLGSAAETVVAAARLGRAFAAALAACPLGPGEPDRTVDEVLARDPRGLYGPEGRPAGGFAAVAAIAADLLGALRASIARLASPRDLLTARLASEIGQVIHVIELVARRRESPGAPLPGWHEEIAAVPHASPDLEAALRISLRQQFFGNRALLSDRLAPAMLRTAFAHLVAVYGGKLRAAADRAPAVRPADLSAGHSLAARVLRLSTIASVFVAHEERAREAIEAVPLLV
jgi:Fe-S-cluster containining protein